jgi:5'-nucleotidase
MLLHAGDFSQGTSYFTKFRGNIEVDLINALRFDVLCLGNHEFDNGIDELARRVRTIKSPVVCANYDFSNTPLDGLVKPWTVVEKAGKKIGVIGLLTDLSSVVSREIAVQLKYQHPAEVADRYGKELKDMGCDLVIALTHLGYEGGQYYTDQELASHTRYVDVIVGGHSHTYLTEMKTVRNLDGSEVKIVTDGKWGLNVGKLSVDFQPNRLTALYEQLKDCDFLPHDSSWFPYPAYDDREGWNAVLGNHAGYLIRAGEKYLGYKWQSVDATAYLAYERTGEREVMQTPLKENRVALNTLLMAELAEGKGRFIDQLINGTWHLSHTPSWVLSAHLPRQKTGRSLPDHAQQILRCFGTQLFHRMGNGCQRNRIKLRQP